MARSRSGTLIYVFVVLAIAGGVALSLIGLRHHKPATLALDDLRWLDPRADRVAALTERPAEPIVSEGLSEEQRFLVDLGRIAFRAPDLLGGLAARWGMSCQACHVNGDRNTAFHIDGLSADTGTFDPTNSFFSTKTQNHRDDPIAIPSLHNVAATAPYPHDGRFMRLNDMVNFVIRDEFQGTVPHPLVLKGLIAYLTALDDTGGSMRVPVTFEREFNDVEEATDTLEKALNLNDPVLTNFIVQAQRRALGRIAQRFQDNTGAQDKLASLSASFRQISVDAEQQDIIGAHSGIAILRQAMEHYRPVLSRAAERSLYNPGLLRAALGAQ